MENEWELMRKLMFTRFDTKMKADEALVVARFADDGEIVGEFLDAQADFDRYLLTHGQPDRPLSADADAAAADLAAFDRILDAVTDQDRRQLAHESPLRSAFQAWRLFGGWPEFLRGDDVANRSRRHGTDPPKHPTSVFFGYLTIGHSSLAGHRILNILTASDSNRTHNAILAPAEPPRFDYKI